MRTRKMKSPKEMVRKNLKIGMFTQSLSILEKCNVVCEHTHPPPFERCHVLNVWHCCYCVLWSSDRMLEMANFKLFSRSFRKTYPRQKRAPNEHDDRTGVVNNNQKLTASSPPSPSSSSTSSYRVTLFGCSRFEPREIVRILAQNLNYEVVFYHVCIVI